jgi:hypothetical protein
MGKANALYPFSFRVWLIIYAATTFIIYAVQNPLPTTNISFEIKNS